MGPKEKAEITFGSETDSNGLYGFLTRVLDKFPIIQCVSGPYLVSAGSAVTIVTPGLHWSCYPKVAQVLTWLKTPLI